MCGNAESIGIRKGGSETRDWETGGRRDGSAETVRRKLSPKKAVSSMEYDYVLGMNQTRLRVKV